MSIFRPKNKPAAPTQRSAMPNGWLGQTFTGLFNGWNSNYSDIDPARGETSMQSVAVGSAIDLITSLVSELPVDVFSGTGEDAHQRTTPGYLLDPDGTGYGVQDWMSQLLASWLLRGNSYGQVLHRGPGGIPTQVSLWNPDQVSPWLSGTGDIQWSLNGKPLDDPKDLIHHRANVIPGRLLGVSPISAHAATIGLNLTGTQFGLQWFRDGAHPSGMLTNSEVPIDGDIAKTTKERFMAAVRGSREPVVMGKGWEFKQIQINPDESQFLETQRYTSAECARIFGPGVAEILGYETGTSLTYNTVQGKSTHFLIFTMNKWITRVERVLSAMLPSPQYVKLNRNALLQSTTLDRFQAHQIAYRNQWTTVNEIRALEDMPPVKWGDEQPMLGPPSPTKAQSDD